MDREQEASSIGRGMAAARGEMGSQIAVDDYRLEGRAEGSDEWEGLSLKFRVRED